MNRTVMMIPHVQWSSTYKKYLGLKCHNMMDGSNIEYIVTRGGEHKAMSSLAHLYSYPPSLCNFSHNSRDAGYTSSHIVRHSTDICQSH